MADSRDPTPLSDDDLLADAISIEGLDDDDAVGAASPSKPPVADVPEPIDIEDDDGDETRSREIRTFDTHKRHEDRWKRTPNVTGQGASHCRTFVSKLRLDAIEHLDEQVNQWLDENPGYEVKNATVSVGILTGKLKEEAMFMTVWV